MDLNQSKLPISLNHHKTFAVGLCSMTVTSGGIAGRQHSMGSAGTDLRDKQKPSCMKLLLLPLETQQSLHFSYDLDNKFNVILRQCRTGLKVSFLIYYLDCWG